MRGHNKNPPINIIIRVLASLTQSGASCWPPEAGRPAVSFGPYCISHTRAATCIRELSEHGDAHAGLLRRGSRDHQPGWASDVWPGGPRDVRAIDSARLLTWGGPAELMEGGPEPLRSSGWKPFGNGAPSLAGNPVNRKARSASQKVAGKARLADKLFAAAEHFRAVAVIREIHRNACTRPENFG